MECVAMTGHFWARFAHVAVLYMPRMPVMETVCCDGAKSVTDDITGEIICCKCGRVMSDLSYGEPMMQDSHAPGITKAYGRHTSTVIGEFDHSGRKINGIKMMQMHDSRTKPRRDGEVKTIKMLSMACDKLGLPERIKIRAIDIIAEAKSEGITRGLPRSAVAAGALNVACRMEGVPRTIAEITGILNARRKLATSAARKIITRFDMRVKPPDASSYMPGITSKIGVGEGVTRKACEMLEEFNARGFCAGKNPLGIAATFVYMACLETGNATTQRNVALAAGVTDITVRNIKHAVREFGKK